VIGGTFLMLSYFGTDQSQVQRYLTARSVDEAKSSLLMSAYWKIPLQALVLLVGVGVFVYYQFVRPPLLFNPAQEAAVVAERGAAYDVLQSRYDEAFTLRESAALAVADASDDAGSTAAMAAFLEREADMQAIRGEALALAEDVTGADSEDVNYIIPAFVLNELPIGLAGLFIAGVIAAAMSSIAAELNSLATTSVIDMYRRWIRPEGTDAHYLAVSKGATALWGVFACFVAIYAATLGSLIEVVNRFGSFFYGSILGVFLLAMIPRAGGWGAFLGLIAGMTVVGFVNFGTDVAYLWQNIIGAVVVLVVGLVIGGGKGEPARA
jgi:Na+/proline symporter